MLRLIVGLVALVGGFTLENACPTLDKLSTDICAALHRGTEKKA